MAGVPPVAFEPPVVATDHPVLDAPPAVGSGPAKIDTRVLEYEVKSAWKRTNLGKVVVAR